MTEPDFDALRARRNEKVLASFKRLAEEEGIPLQELKSTFDPSACYCACVSGGPCEHRWDGEVVDFDGGLGWSATCSRCGCTAIGHSMRVGP